MKKIILPTLITCLGIYGFTTINNNKKTVSLLDNYKVIKVDGRIIFANNGKDMHTGDQFNSDEKLEFKTQESRAAVISKQKGRFVLKPSATNSNAANLLPAMNNVSSRAGALINTIDLKNHFSDNYLVLDEMDLKINESAYPMSKDNFFYVQYQYNGEAINKKLGFKGDTLELNPKEIFTIDNKLVEIPLKTKMSIYYRNNAEGKSIKISDFNLIVPNDNELVEELNIITGELTDKENNKVKDEITGYLNEFYGKPQKDNLNYWLKKHMHL